MLVSKSRYPYSPGVVSMLRSAAAFNQRQRRDNTFNKIGKSLQQKPQRGDNIFFLVAEKKQLKVIVLGAATHKTGNPRLRRAGGASLRTVTYPKTQTRHRARLYISFFSPLQKRRPFDH